MSEKCEHGSLHCALCHDASGNLKENERMEITSTVLLAIVARLDASRQQQREWAEKAADQKQHDWAARYTSVADAYTEAIDAINEAIANAPNQAEAR